MKVLLDLIISSIRFQKNESVLDIFPTDFCDKIDVIYFMGEMTQKKDDKSGGDLYAIYCNMINIYYSCPICVDKYRWQPYLGNFNSKRWRPVLGCNDG